ncbi:MAG: CHAD domain-containing protein [Euryarchaeota archaeon]|nr:CHAD domain-containing protein [Euryarchaeota archaeon]
MPPRNVPRVVDLSEFLRRAQARSLRVHRLLVKASRSSFAPPEFLHDLHREVRRARVDARVLQSTVRSGSREGLQELESMLAELSQRVGEARDRDVLEADLRRLSHNVRPPVARMARTLAGELHKEGRVLRRRLGRDAKRALTNASVRLPSGLQGLRGPGARARFARAVREELAEARRELGRAHRRARRHPSVRRLHRLRISLRRLRHLRTSLAHHPREADLEARWRRLQRDLGAHHDLGVLEDWVSERAAPETRKRLRRLLHEELERRRMRAENGLTLPASPALHRLPRGTRRRSRSTTAQRRRQAG